MQKPGLCDEFDDRLADAFSCWGDDIHLWADFVDTMEQLSREDPEATAVEILDRAAKEIIDRVMAPARAEL